jgi:Tol biopolymer transport system component
MDADGTNLRQLTFGGASDVDSAFSPDGNWLVYTSQITNDNEVNTSLKKISTSGGETVLLADIDCLAPNFSPDEQFISCVYTQNSSPSFRRKAVKFSKPSSRFRFRISISARAFRPTAGI